MIYAENPKVLAKNKDEIIIDFDGKRVPIYKEDMVVRVLLDSHPGELDYDTPTVHNISFNSFYSYINGADDSGDYEFDGFLTHIRGISVCHSRKPF